MVDTGVAFLVIVIVALFAGFPLWLVIVIAAVAGACGVPFTRRLERRELERIDESETPLEP
jgi:type III secretory pathway component EscV